MSRDYSAPSFRHLRHWPALFGVGIFKLLTRLPWPVQTALGRSMGWLFFHVVRIRRHVVATNLRLAFPGKTPREQHALAAAHYQSLGLGLFETCLAWWAPMHRLPPHEIVGREHLEAAQARGRGVLLLTAHFTTLEICARMLAGILPFGCLYREANNAVIAKQMRLAREARTLIAVPMDDLRGLLRALKQGHTIWYAPDQGKRTKLSAMLPFFGVPAMTNTATSRLAEMTGASVVPYFGLRRPDGSYLLTILPALDNFPTADAEADSLRINRLFEEHISKAPEQYFWVHRRFKLSRREPSVYTR
ncbi:MAG: lipid biosynthesis lauroyl (or palmitoleoyl) acyltransferase [Rariglobus sp.]|jgi:KDO2-lipid IV(A) lauroyltransferase|nr:lipid biosynthesis lauroyl (or palmitoleoyl) acyltransferase [Rariglobus sp.]